ncbi:hypothetical protein EV129_110122 [Rhizobium azibense]|uniref:Uncharacterized protein n=1 Tax=Rhizobium azibense TaxID=1136135 RepID=A0A4R3RTV9_9HYPH|nr:hypothetical protein EV129_110122 [Rhizobium azibense]
MTAATWEKGSSAPSVSPVEVQASVKPMNFGELATRQAATDC